MKLNTHLNIDQILNGENDGRVVGKVADKEVFLGTFYTVVLDKHVLD